MRELSLCLEHRRQHASVRHSDVSSNVPQSAARQPSYINQPLALQLDSSDDDSDYVKPSREVTVDRDDDEDDEVDDDDDDDDDSSECDALGRPRHEYINVRTRQN